MESLPAKSNRSIAAVSFPKNINGHEWLRQGGLTIYLRGKRSVAYYSMGAFRWLVKFSYPEQK